VDDEADGPVDRNGVSPPVSITPRDGGPGVEVVDHVERHRFELWTEGPVTPEPADGDRIRLYRLCQACVDATTDIGADLPDEQSNVL